ncbi:nuclear transport factor 2 family protein [Nocardioides sp. SYSU D00038]|uniref:nuclear transport factor 2 family protein n=1 Tax=Nocardioides sp. SYSU D00038 TaxID=2812554 RepID=UPI001968554E|nr:nuclear transport factor 2 family protein [Nocardioides sp. SYSU D00038]
MVATREQIEQTVRAYVDRVATGTADQVLELYADGATVEDPVGTEVRTTRESIREFYAPLETMDQTGRLVTVRIAGNEAAFEFELVSRAGDQTYTLSPIDVMTFDDDGRITSMRAFWSGEDMVVG